MTCRRSSPTAESRDPPKQGPDVLDPNRENRNSSPPVTSARSPAPALASASTAIETKGGGKVGEGSSPPSLTSAASTNPAWAAAPGRSTNGDQVEDGDWLGDGENSPAALSTGAGTSRPLSASSATCVAEPVKGGRIPAFNFSFAMGGWLMFYSFGVAKCLLDHGLHKVRPMQQSFIGSSAGSLAAAALALEADIDKIVEQAKSSFIPRAHAAKYFGFVYGMFYIGKFLKECMLACLPVEKVPGSTSPPGRLVVVMASVLGWKSVRAREFGDGDDLIDALRCSCACFPLVMPHSFRGKRCFDGFFSEGASAPALDEGEAEGLPTVTISPLYASAASIRPSRYVPLSWIALPPNDTGAIDWLYDLGYRDALFWMSKEGIEHTCSHVSRLSRFSKKRSTAAAATATGAAVLRARISALESSDSSDSDSSDSSDNDNDNDNDNDSGSDNDDISRDRRHTNGAAAVTAPPAGPARNCNTSNDRCCGNQGANKISPSKTSTSTSPPPVVAGRRGERGEEIGRKGAAASGDKAAKRLLYVRHSFALSKCHMRPRRERHRDLDAPRFVPSLEKFVGHGSYHAAADFAFVVFFNAVWRPAAALILLVDLVTRLLLACARGFAKDLRPLLWWLTPTLLLGGAALEHSPSGLEGLAAALAVAAAVFVRRGDAAREEWQKAGRCVRALVDFRCVLVITLLPWAGGRGRGGDGGGGGGGDEGRGRVRSEALERSFMYRVVSFFM